MKRPEVKPPKPFKIKAPKRTELPSGAVVETFQREGQLLASVGIVLDIPLTLEPPDKEGVAGLTYSLVDQGTKKHPGETFNEKLADLGASIGGSVSYSATIARMDVPVNNLKPALELAIEGLHEATFTDADCERMKNIRLSDIDLMLSRASTMASVMFRKAVIQDKYREGRLRVGSTETVGSLEPDDLREFYRRYYQPYGASIIFAGDFDEDPADLAYSLGLDWQPGDLQRPPAEAPKPGPAKCLLIDNPGAVQADVELGGFGLDFMDPDYARLWVACYAMGGAFLSRLNKVLREEKGFTYGAHMSNFAMRSGGLLAASGAFRNEVAVEAINEMHKLTDVSKHPFTQAEVDDALSFAAGSNPGQYQTAQQLCDSMCDLGSVGLSYDYVNSFNEALIGVTPEAATEVYSRLMQWPTLVVVGDAESLEQPLKDSGWPVEVVSGP
ncbi:MAG: insulinase family protein [Propionibacteriaceae bacterium]|jgi:predicted Zn-dependent peptidase|nr:insulinase family protein [Propionibacteriaceae bacterium]